MTNKAQSPQPSPKPQDIDRTEQKTGLDPAIDITNTFNPDQTLAGQGKEPRKQETPEAEEKPEAGKKEEVKDIFEEGLEFEPEPEKIPKEPSMQDIRPQPEKAVPTSPSPPLPREAPRELRSTPPSTETTIPPEEQEALNKIQGTKLSDLGVRAAPSEQPGTPPPGGPPPPKKRSFCGLLIGILLLVLIFGGGGYAYFAFFAKVALTITLNVDGAEVVIDDQSHTNQVTNNQLRVSLSPGSHKFKISKENYFTYKKSLNVGDIPKHKLEIELRPYPEPVQVLQYKVSDLSADFENGYLYYRSNGGRTFYRIKIDDEGKGRDAKAISPDTMTPVSKVIWSLNHKYAILKVTQGAAVSGTPFAGQSSPTNAEMTFLYDFAEFDKDKQAPSFLGDNIGDIKWVKDNKFYIVQGKQIFKTDTGFSEFKTILDFTDEDYENPQIFVSKNETYLALIPRSENYNLNNIVLFDTEPKQIFEITEDGGKLSLLFNPVKESLLVFSTFDEESRYKEKLDMYSVEIQELNLDSKLSKVFWLDAERLLYAKYNESSKTDDLEILDITDETTIPYKYLGKGVELNELWFDETSKYLYFINKELIYSLKLDDGEY